MTVTLTAEVTVETRDYATPCGPSSPTPEPNKTGDLDPGTGEIRDA